VTEWDEHAIPELEDRVVDLTFDLSTTPALEEAPAEPDEDEDVEDGEEEPVEGVEELVDELRGRIADALAPEPADQVIATGPGYEVLDSDPDSVKPDSEQG
jgi:hypothetical protein